MIDLATFQALATMDLGPMEPKPTSIEGNQTEASVALASHNGGKVEIGVWECTPGRFTADRSHSAEFCHFIAGKAKLTNHKGKSWIVKKGDAFIIPAGFRGTWETIEKVRKHYVILQPES